MAAASPMKQMRKGIKGIASYGRLGGRPWRSGGLACGSLLGARARLWALAADKGLHGVPASRRDKPPTPMWLTLRVLAGWGGGGGMEDRLREREHQLQAGGH